MLTNYDSPTLAGLDVLRQEQHAAREHFVEDGNLYVIREPPFVLFAQT
mgnify:CR=1 FL=1